ncbi:MULTISPECIES: hypothetical protein [unclassified Acinetobacter]|uniref:hypothetical protein n=1 Tax=unclassified Acinetobacter TaxID=196816 RepID=UPI002578A7D1|nr:MULTISPECIES: hypothetical protein [unclassified Acinetobacter]MDM1758080.1 hypothetical protein [Acinetobacter sp. 256-1]MDM1761213.1 hypothetical protein [Acinetobacter sp. 251-1]
MKKVVIVLSAILMTACTHNKLLLELPSPNKTYRIEVLQCQENGSFWGTEKLQIAVPSKGTSKCQSAVDTYIVFSSGMPLSDLQLEWISDTEIRAWHPSFNPKFGPYAATLGGPNDPIKISFKPK